MLDELTRGRGVQAELRSIDGVAAVVVPQYARGAFYPTGGKLQAEAHALGADMLVAGAFGHPRLWEKMLGGVTQDLIARMSLPIFMSH
jgi:nucleotide-binding universal stress UspA family protein